MDTLKISGLVDMVTPIAKKWIVIFRDHYLAYDYETFLEDLNWYVFAPVVWVKPNMPRFCGDGPSSTCDYLTVARRKVGPEIWGKGSRPGHYIVKAAKPDGQTVGRKNLDGMRALIRDYSAKGDLIVDPFAGSATTLIAAAMEGRRAIGCEVNPDTYSKAVDRIRRGYTPNLF
jgi:site-specific DNA-methyltransferase (adenine-specific)